LAEKIEARVGREVLVPPGDAELLIEAHARGRPNGVLEAVIRTSRADGSEVGVRELTSDQRDCVELGDKIALVVAVTIDPDAALAEPGPEPATQSAREPQPAPAPARRPEIRVVIERERVIVREPDTPARPWELESRVAATGSIGLLPGLTPGLLAAFGVMPPGFPLVELTGQAWFEREAEAEGGGANFTLLAAGLSVCPSVDFGAWRSHFCGGLTGGSMRAHGFGFDDSREQARALVLVTAGLRASIDLGPTWFVFGGARIEAAVVRPRFFYEDAAGDEQDVHRVPPVGAMGELGIGLTFSS
jgi:hypothetical protein